MEENKSKEFSSLRDRLTGKQKEILSSIWHYFCEHRKWIPAHRVHRDFGKEAVVTGIRGLGGSIIFQTSDAGKEYYQLTLLGVLLTDQEDHAVEMLTGYLGYLHSRFLTEPEFDKVRSEEVEGALNISAKQSMILYQLISLGRFCRGSSGPGAGGWNVEVPREVDELPDGQALSRYVHERAMETFDPNLPVAESARMVYSVSGRRKEKASNEFWFIRNPSLRQQLEEDWQEAQMLPGIRAWKSCVVICGSVLEGILFDRVGREPKRALEVYKEKMKKSPPDIDRWGLAELLEVASEMRVLRPGTLHLSRTLREFRNLIHPGRQVRDELKTTQEEADIAVSAVKILLREMPASIGDGG